MRSFLYKFGLVGMITTVTNFFWHPFPFLRCWQFMLGMVVGEAALSVELSPLEARRVARVTDVIFVSFMYAKFSGSDDSGWITYILHNYPLAFVLFGLGRAGADSWTAKLLKLPIFLAFVPYTMTAYLIHFPVLFWAQFVMNHGIESFGELFSRIYRESNCQDQDQHWGIYINGTLQENEQHGYPPPGNLCYLPWGSMITLFAVIIVGAIIVEICVQVPAAAWLTRKLLPEPPKRTH